MSDRGSCLIVVFFGHKPSLLQNSSRPMAIPPGGLGKVVIGLGTGMVSKKKTGLLGRFNELEDVGLVLQIFLDKGSHHFKKMITSVSTINSVIPIRIVERLELLSCFYEGILQLYGILKMNIVITCSMH